MPINRAFLICTLAAACSLPSHAAIAFCSKPITPYCTEDENLADGYVSEERCRRALNEHVQDLTRYRNCLIAEIEQIDEAVERFKSLLGEGGEKSWNLPAIPAAPGAQATAEAAS